MIKYDFCLTLAYLLVYLNMSKKPLPLEERKIKIGISIDRELDSYLEIITKNKSKFIENLIRINYEDTRREKRS